MAVDIDAGLRVGGQHVGPKRSPLYDTDAIIGLVRAVVERPGFHLAGVMTYEGQIAGIPDTVPTQKARSLIVRRLKHASVSQLEVRRREIADAIAKVAELEFWNAGGSGSVDSTTLDPVVTEIAAGSGLLVPGPLRPLRVVRAAPRGVLRPPRRPPPQRPDGHRARRRPGRVGRRRQGPAADPVGAVRPAPDRARGRRRGADPADRTRVCRG